eukprot:TRINITY_DN25414_c0_g3_i3.p1 TRINITY_DN25414_c0_g3~~TRINITY_DN25414_c0_g3_i3.p1  ORF type:complete len:520 (+),score=109.27 TRINITY_DN25414_c0_g3_i3:80-1639(+)
MRNPSSDDLSGLALSRDSSSLTSVSSNHSVVGNVTAAEQSKPTGKSAEIVLLFAAPLAYVSAQRQRVGLEPLDYDRERQTVAKAIHDAGAAIKLRFEFATTDTFRSVVTMGGCRVLHYSGHGSTKYIGMEDGRAGMHKVEVGMLQQLFAAGGDTSPEVSLVFVSACRSQAAAEGFSAVGVKHVVAVHSEARVNDTAVRSFTRAFYLALASKKSVQQSFDIAREAVLTSPQVQHSAAEAQKFLLLGASDDHSEILFNDTELCNPGKAAAPALALLAQDDVPAVPEGFMGRSLEVYEAVCGTLDRRLVTITGAAGLGKSAVAVSMANYLSERRNDSFVAACGDGVCFVDGGQIETAAQLEGVIASGLTRGKETAIATSMIIRQMRAVVVLDHCSTLWRTSPDAMQTILRLLLTQMRGIRVVLVLKEPLNSMGIQLQGVNEKVVRLVPLSLVDSARLFVRKASRRVDPSEVGVDAACEVIPALAQHPLISYLQGHVGSVVYAAGLLDDYSHINLLEEHLRSR